MNETIYRLLHAYGMAMYDAGFASGRGNHSEWVEKSEGALKVLTEIREAVENA